MRSKLYRLLQVACLILTLSYGAMLLAVLATSGTIMSFAMSLIAMLVIGIVYEVGDKTTEQGKVSEQTTALSLIVNWVLIRFLIGVMGFAWLIAIIKVADTILRYVLT